MRSSSTRGRGPRPGGDDPEDTARHERRALPRHEVVDRWAQIAWRGFGMPTSKVPALLLDISGRGAGVVASTLPPPGGPTWLGLVSLAGEWVRVDPRAIRAEEERWIIHFAFREPCPAGLFERATSGAGGPSPAWGLSPHPSRLEMDWFPPRRPGEEAGDPRRYRDSSDDHDLHFL